MRQNTNMMMETAVYCREFLFAQELVERGELGKIQFLRGQAQSGNVAGQRAFYRSLYLAVDFRLRDRRLSGWLRGRFASACHG